MSLVALVLLHATGIVTAPWWIYPILITCDVAAHALFPTTPKIYSTH